MAPASQPILSPTVLQILLYLNSWYFAAFYVAEVLMFIYKGLLACLVHHTTISIKNFN